MVEFEDQEREFARGSVRVYRGGLSDREVFTVSIWFDHPIGIGIEQMHDTPEAALAHYEEVVASGGPSVVEYAWEAACMEAWGPDDRWTPVAERYEEAAIALTPQQREIATALHLDAKIPFMAALEAARLVMP